MQREILRLLSHQKKEGATRLKDFQEVDALKSLAKNISIICELFAIKRPTTNEAIKLICQRIVIKYPNMFPDELIDAFVYGSEGKPFEVNTEHYGRPFNLDSCSKILAAYFRWRRNAFSELKRDCKKIEDSKKNYVAASKVQLLTSGLTFKK